MEEQSEAYKRLIQETPQRKLETNTLLKIIRFLEKQEKKKSKKEENKNEKE